MNRNEADTLVTQLREQGYECSVQRIYLEFPWFGVMIERLPKQENLSNAKR